MGADISEFCRADLAKRWEAIYGSPPPRTIKRPLLERAVAWHLQAKLYGGLPAKTKRQLAAIGAGSGGSPKAGPRGECRSAWGPAADRHGGHFASF